MRTIEELKDLYDNWRLVCKRPIKPIVFKDQETTSPLPEDTIIDPEQSVNWNRQTVALYNEALTNNIKTHMHEMKEAERAYISAYHDFVINHPDYGNGELTLTNIDRLRSFMYDYREDDYNYSNGFYNHMGMLRHLIEVWRHTY